MITWLTMFLQKIEGANLFLAVVVFMWILYLGFFLVLKANRRKKQIKFALIYGVIATLISDFVWFFKFFDNLDYKNPGLGGIAWIVLLPVLMFLLVMVQSYLNVNQYEHEKKISKKENTKNKKKEKRKKKLEKAEE